MSLKRAGTPDFKVLREVFSEHSCMGKLFYKDEFVCYTLEDAVRDKKLYARTAIPTGIYELRLSFSYRFQVTLPEILSVPGYRGVRIHGGNTHEDTEGCILVAKHRDVQNCRIWGKETARVIKLIGGSANPWIAIQGEPDGPENYERAVP